MASEKVSSRNRLWLGLSVLSGLAHLAVAYLVVNAVSSRFERIVVDLLVMMYAWIRIDGLQNSREWSAAKERDFDRRLDTDLRDDATREERELRIRELDRRISIADDSLRDSMQSVIRGI